ncbi:cbb3-type cytochrome oxidase subunit 3 [Glaciecola sp. 2405UD65-10]|jgi:cytochrome c oxidase cbb3-type subunit 4|uniref:cbb3-type cytochrome oxidase subunit 3 n=1 Tax=Glaciecola sp. 2405UD65-10 TaxID=3397244 RepID=UPI003B5CB3AE
MDQGLVGSIFTVIVFVAFIGACWWAFSSRNKDKFDEVANSIIGDEDINDNNELRNKDQES